MFQSIGVHRAQLIEQLDRLTAQDWDANSLCKGWKVRDVVGHLVSILDVPMPKFVGKAILAGSFDRIADRFAREFGALEQQELLDAYRRVANKRFAPPGIGPIAPLTDLLVHIRDIERPLNLSSTIEEVSMHTVLGFVCGGKARGFVPAKRTNGLRFVATDSNWSIGAGPVVTGTGEAIMMAVTDRRVALQDLSGDGLAMFAERFR
jgi:uncharacterized protein (TIGR03083 family)